MSMRKLTYIKFYKEFDKICSKIEEIPDIEIVDRHKSASHIKDNAGLLDCVSPKLKYIISELKKRIKSSSKKQQVTIKSNRLKFRSETEDRIGPGCYLGSGKDRSESHQFSTIPRLKTPITHNILNIENLYPVKELSPNEIIKKNKILATNPDVYRSLKQSRLSTEKFREDYIKEKKKSMILLDRKEKINRLKKKEKLFEWRSNKKALNSVVKTWVVLDVIFGLVFVLKQKGTVKRKLKSKWEVVLRKFVVVFKATSKFVRRLNRIRKNIRKRTLSNLYYPVIDFIRFAISSDRKLIQGTLIEYADLPYLSKLMVKVKFCVLKVQRCFKSFRKIRQARIEVLKVMWEVVYKQHIKENPDKAGAIERIGAIKRHMVEKYISGYLKGIVIEYVSEFNKFLIKCAEENVRVGSSWWNANRPRVFIYRKKEKLLKLIEKAIKLQDLQQKKQRYLKYSSLK